MVENAPQRILYLSPIEVNEIYAFLSAGKLQIEFPAPCNLEHKERVDARFLAGLLIDFIKEHNNDRHDRR